MIINDKYKFMDKEGNDLEPTRDQLIIFISDTLKKKDEYIDELVNQFQAELRDHEKFCLETKHEIAIRDRALQMACEDIIKLFPLNSEELQVDCSALDTMFYKYIYKARDESSDNEIRNSKG